MPERRREWCQSVGVPGIPPPKSSLPQFPKCTHGQADSPHMCTACLHVCKYPQGRKHAARATRGACQGAACICMPACVRVRACTSPPATVAADAWADFHLPTCSSMCNCVHTHTGLYTCVQAPLPWAPAPAGPLAVPLAAPSACATLRGTRAHTAGCVYTCAHACAQACCHPSSSRGKRSPRPGAPTPQLLGDSEAQRCHELVCICKAASLLQGAPGRGLTPRSQGPSWDAQGCRHVSHAHTPHTALAHTLAWACFINGNYTG